MKYDVSVIGDVSVDLLSSHIERFPEEDTQISCDFSFFIGGQTGNCAAACSSLGLKTVIFAAVGKDVLSSWLIQELKKFGPDVKYIKVRGGKCGMTIAIQRGGKRTMFTSLGANATLKCEDIDFEIVKRSRFLMRGGHWNVPGLFSENERIFRFAHKNGIPTGFDLGWDHTGNWSEERKETVYRLLPYTTFLFVNEKEFEKLGNPECKNIILHEGEKGSSWISEEGVFHSPALSVSPSNPTGVGDVFNAGFIWAYLNNYPKEACLRFANVCAAIHICRKENTFPRLEEVLSRV
ncbi:MAG: carbohydrate kinase family protein [Candidatus Syntropharchaeia archaeon]